jgi:phenylalanyl-tRNA synthetase beta chain
MPLTQLKLKGKPIVVKKNAAGTKFTALDGTERTLTAHDLTINDIEKPMCIAGVFGGISSGVKETTTSIFLESAWFENVHIRKDIGASWFENRCGHTF